MTGAGSTKHNERAFIAENVDKERVQYNIEYCNEKIQDVYQKLFGEALKKYNAKQTRNDRRIENYYEKIRTGKQENPFEEVIVQVGDKDTMGAMTENGQLAKQILDEYMKSFAERNPYMYVFSAHLHMDEATLHLHLDYISVAHGYKKGMKTRNSLTKAFQEMGFDKAMDKKYTETMEWQKRERDYIRQLCREKEIFVVRKGEVRDNYSISEYKEAMRAKESVERETVEMKEHLEALTKRMKAYSLEADTLPVVKKAIDKEVNEINSTVKKPKKKHRRCSACMATLPKSTWPCP